MDLLNQDPNQTQQPSEDQPAQPAIFQDDTEWLSEITKDFERLQKQKSRVTGGVEARILQNCAFEWGEHYIAQTARGLVSEVLDENKLHLVFNFIDQKLSKLLGRLSSIAPEFKARPDKQDPKSKSEAQVVDKLIRALDEKLDQPSKTWEILWWMAVGGVSFEYVPWVPDSTNEPEVQFSETGEILFKHKADGKVFPQSQVDQMVQGGLPQEMFEIYEEVARTGDVGSRIYGPLNIFIDQSVRSVEDLAPDQAVYIAEIKTMGWIEETYGPQEGLEGDKELKIVTTPILQDGQAVASMFLKDLIPTIQGVKSEDDPEMAVVVHRYQPISSKNPHGKYTCFIPSKKILFDGPNPYDEIPLVDFHWKPVTTTFWNKDFITDLISPQRFINKRMSQIGEQANASIYDKVLLGPTLTQNDIPSDYPGFVKNGLTDTGVPMAQRMGPPDLPQWFLESIDMTIKMANEIAGGADLMSEQKFPGQLRGPMAVPMLQEILDSEWGPLFNHIGQRMAKVKQMRLARVKQFYPPQRTLHYTDVDERDDVLDFHADKILKSGTNYNVSVERGSLLPELRALRESRIIERLNSPLSILYTDDRTGRIDKTKIAADLHEGDSGREGREAQAREFANQLIEKLWQGAQVPPVMQFWDHEPMLDELEAAMMSTEWLSASPQVQQLFTDRWNQHTAFISQKAQAQQASMQNQMVHAAMAQATQQVAAQTAAQTVEVAMDQVRAQHMVQPSAQQMVSAQVQSQFRPPAPRPVNPSGQPAPQPASVRKPIG